MDHSDKKNTIAPEPNKRQLAVTTDIPGPVGPELHVCMGLNSCKNQGFTKQNDCAGMGLCATIVHACHTVNDCRGQGGCGLFGTAPEFCHPGENDCKYQGSCGSPILATRYFVDGPNQGLSVWQLARKRFEERMNKAGKKYGSPPPRQAYGPTAEFAEKIGQYHYESCGQSGSHYCSFAFDPKVKDAERKAKREAFMKNSSKAHYSDEACVKKG